MSVEENKALARSWFDFPGLEEWLQRRLGTTHGEKTKDERLRIAIAEIYAPDWVAHMPQGDIGFDSFVNQTIALIEAFSDMSFSVEGIIAEGDMVAVRYIMRGTHQGPYQGIPATGKSIEIGGINTARVSGGKFVEGWSGADRLSLMQQLGLIPSK